MTKLTNAKGRPFAWSYSRRSDFENCPAKYAASHFYCTVPYTESKEAQYGNRVHKAAEMFLKGKPHPDVEALLPVEKYCEKMIRTGCPIKAELQIALTRDLRPTSWFSGTAWCRMQIDVVLEKTKTQCLLFDFKTGGNIRHDEEQLRVNIAGLSVLYPQYEQYEGRYIWTKHDEITTIKPVSKQDCQFIWEDALARAYKMEEAWRLERFPPKPSPLCPRCAVEGCKVRRGERRV